MKARLSQSIIASTNTIYFHRNKELFLFLESSKVNEIDSIKKKLD